MRSVDPRNEPAPPHQRRGARPNPQRAPRSRTTGPPDSPASSASSSIPSGIVIYISLLSIDGLRKAVTTSMWSISHPSSAATLRNNPNVDSFETGAYVSQKSTTRTCSYPLMTRRAVNRMELSAFRFILYTHLPPGFHEIEERRGENESLHQKERQHSI